MPLLDKLALAGIVFVFVSFGLLMATVCWLDGKDERLRRRQERNALPAKTVAAMHPSAAVHN
jgi:hypothetical protein